MMQFIRLHSVLLGVLGLLVAILATFVALANAWPMIITIAIAVAVAAGLTALVAIISRDLAKIQAAQVILQERLQQYTAVFATDTDGWCVFNAEGLLVAASLFEKGLFPQKMNHFDDLVAAVDDGSAMVEKYRLLQQTGQTFTLILKLRDGSKTILVRGQRYPEQREARYFIMHIRDAAMILADGDRVKEANGQKEDAVRTQALQQALDSLATPLWLRDQTLRLVWCNAAYARWLDCPRADILAAQRELYPPQTDSGGSQELATRARATGSAQERWHLVVEGQRRLVACVESVIPEPSGFGMVGMAHDVTAIEDIERELQRHIAAHHEVLENLGTPIAIYGADQRLEFYNRAYVRLWDCDENFLISKPSFNEILEDLRTRRRAPEQVDFQRYKRERTSLFTSLLEPREDMLHLPDGTTLRVVAVPHPFGGLMFLHEDVTDKLALESSYNTLIAVQRETLDNLAEGIAVFGPDGKLKLFNPAFARIWHLHPDDLLTEPHINELVEQVKSLARPDHWAEFRRDMIAYALERLPREGRMERADNAVIEFHTVPLPDGAVLNSYVDVTDSIKVEQALRESNAALATADRLKSEFVANVSYQLRTPLNTIMGFAEILANQYFGTLNERQLEYARTMMESSKRLKLLIDDVIDLATVDAGRMVLNRREVAIAPLLQAVIGMMGEWARQQALELVIDTEQGIGSFEVDEKRIKQVLFNLVSNAIQYTPPGGRITLQARRDKNAIHLNVIDNGIGIPQQDQDRIWNKFERTNIQSRQSGVGLGLALVRSFIELHGGTIKIVSVVNKGTQISCMLPIRAHNDAERIPAITLQ